MSGEWDAYSAGMQRTWLLLICVVVLVFFGIVYLAYLAWPKMAPKRRIVSLLLLAPDFLIVVCIVVSASCASSSSGIALFQ